MSEERNWRSDIEWRSLLAGLALFAMAIASSYFSPQVGTVATILSIVGALLIAAPAISEFTLGKLSVKMRVRDEKAAETAEVVKGLSKEMVEVKEILSKISTNSSPEVKDDVEKLGKHLVALGEKAQANSASWQVLSSKWHP
ncbi:MAG: hypothetical protein WBX25_35720 [Rhodomicrobium sp.]